jgi:hypothetical protein
MTDGQFRIRDGVVGVVEQIRRLPSRYEWRSLSDDHKFRALYEAISLLEEQSQTIYGALHERIRELEQAMARVQEGP